MKAKHLAPKMARLPSDWHFMLSLIGNEIYTGRGYNQDLIDVLTSQTTLNRQEAAEFVLAVFAHGTVIGDDKTGMWEYHEQTNPDGPLSTTNYK